MNFKSLTMRMFIDFIFVLITFGRVLSYCNCKQDPEPVCHRYDYEEKLLAKTIRLEYTVEELAKSKNEIGTKCIADLEKITEKIEILETDIKEIKTKEIKTASSEDEKGLRPKTCPSSYMYDDEVNLCWRLQKGVQRNWFDAREECSKQGAHLMILNTTASVKVMQNYLIAADSGTVYLGAHDMMEDGTFKWINGEAVQQILWYPRQPGGGTNENCLAMTNSMGQNFHDKPCSSKFNVLCQITI